jgi:hypothetical protein
MDKYVVESPMVSEDLFRLRTNQMTSTQEDLASITPDEEAAHSEYVA